MIAREIVQFQVSSIYVRLIHSHLRLDRVTKMSVNEYTSVTEAIERLSQRGFTANFEFLDNAFKAMENGKIFHANELTILEHHRFEGQSDPEDMAIVYAIEGNDGTRGVLVDAFGAYADPGLGQFLQNVKHH